MATFLDFNLSERITRALAELGYEQPTPVQEQAIPAVLAGSDVLACAQTGTGKTAAFALPMLQLLMDNPIGRGQRVPIRCLVLSPTRELAQQISDNMGNFHKHTFLRHTAIFGGVPFGKQIRDLKKGVDVVVGTPGRVMDLMRQGYLSLDQVQFFVLDEADRMLDMGFAPDIKSISSAMPNQPQTLLFSATMPPNIKKLANDLLTDPVYIEIVPQGTAAETVEQSLYHVRRENKFPLLQHLLESGEIGRTLIFTRTKNWADELAERLQDAGIDSEALHGDIRQSRRLKLLEQFKKGRTKILVATDVASRGIDVSGIELVINYDLPEEPETYVHRIGRTGRAGASGKAYSFCSPADKGLLKAIERTLQKTVPVVETHPYHNSPSESGGGEHGGRRKGGRGSGFGGGSPRGPRSAEGRTAWASRPPRPERAEARPERAHRPEGQAFDGRADRPAHSENRPHGRVGARSEGGFGPRREGGFEGRREGGAEARREGRKPAGKPFPASAGEGSTRKKHRKGPKPVMA